ncbi:hypothetical protein C8046_11815 [Serinibacter arcticus]|uniref:Lipoprotein n=1 Tax=Serinibacter arcticus TaxID=1655435 RepID=A0A2U1ZW81_9MICO|nr:hypothetical protein [Serinibacter arcticus]PWD51238.1 hypothetical protein C8046_11815 [Serinibacter arcticus]
MPRSPSRFHARHPARPLAVALAALIALTACTPSEAPVDDQTRSSVAATTQRYAESVAAQLGTSSQVQQEEWADCTDAATGEVTGEQYIYNVRVDLDGEETFEQLSQRLRDHFEGEGWTWVEPTGSLPRVRLSHEGYNIGTTLEVERGYATVGVGAGCLGSLEDVPEQDRATS